MYFIERRNKNSLAASILFMKTGKSLKSCRDFMGGYWLNKMEAISFVNLQWGI